MTSLHSQRRLASAGLAGFLIALFCAASAAHAQQTYSLTGKLIGQVAQRGFFPADGSAENCGFTWREGAYMMTPSTLMTAEGCLSGAGTITTPASGTSANMQGARFQIPQSFFQLMAPGMLNVVVNTTVASIVQQATSFAATVSTPNVSMLAIAAQTNHAVWGEFRANAWTAQGDRSAADFSWCPGVVGPCSNPIQGALPILVKYSAKAAKFGGTMAGILRAGTHPSSVAASCPLDCATASMSLAVVQLPPCPPGSTMCETQLSGAAGAGYNVTAMFSPPLGMRYTDFDLTSMGQVGRVGMYAGPAQTAMFTSVGFPWTTGTVLVRKTGMTDNGGPDNWTISAQGYDSVSPNGIRNIQLVAGRVARAVVGTAVGHNHVGINQMKFVLPEPSLATAGLAGFAVLLGIGAWRVRRKGSASARKTSRSGARFRSG